MVKTPRLATARKNSGYGSTESLYQKNAFFVFEDDIAGTIEIGKRADFVVLSADPRAVESFAIKDINVIATIIGGELVYGSLD